MNNTSLFVPDICNILVGTIAYKDSAKWQTLLLKMVDGIGEAVRILIGRKPSRINTGDFTLTDSQAAALLFSLLFIFSTLSRMEQVCVYTQGLQYQLAFRHL